MISWSESKNEILKAERGISFEDACAEIESGRLLDLIDHPSRSHQQIYIIRLNGYAHAVPFVKDPEGNIFLKTIYPTREFQSKYGGKP